MTDRLLIAFVFDVGEVARNLEAESLTLVQLSPALVVGAFEEVADTDAQDAGDLVEPAGGDTVHAALVLVCLLIGDPDQLRELLLSETEEDPALPNSQAHVAFNDLGFWR